MRRLGDNILPKKEAVHEVNPMSITRGAIIDQLVAQVSKHEFAHLNRNKATGHSAHGWSGGLQMYSANEKQPNPAGHFRWLNAILAKVAKCPDAQNQIKLANEILEWGGMRTRIKDTDAGHSLLCRVLTSAKRGEHVENAPMNSSYTKIAAVFGYGEGENTIWDSRVSTAVCFRLACLLVNAKCTPEDATRLFPDLGYVAGMSKRVQRRLELVGRYWPNVYQKWSGHFAAARLLKEIAHRLEEKNVSCPKIDSDSDAEKWTPWKVNMVFFADNITACPSDDSGPSSESPDLFENDRHKLPGSPKAVAASATSEDGGCRELCGHRIVNQNAGIHFEPDSIAQNGLNSAPALHLPFGAHGLEHYRLLLEFFRMTNGNCKISARVRVDDPAFDKLTEAATEANCPGKQGGIDLGEQTSSIFVYRLGKIAEGGECAAIRDFTCKPQPSYRRFLKLLPDAMRPPY